MTIDALKKIFVIPKSRLTKTEHFFMTIFRL